MAREEHYAAVDNAKYAVGEMQELLSALTERQESAMGAVIMVVGQNPNVESAQNAMNFTAEVRNRVEEIYTITNGIIAELERYQGGF